MGNRSRTSWGIWCVFLLSILQRYNCSPSPDHHVGHQAQSDKPKLLYIMLDGFRWDYVDKQSETALPSFTKFLDEGVRARWTNPLFPSLSYPTWTSLVTGQFAETHGVVGNYFYDAVTKETFSLFDSESTGKQKWWTSEPIWTTAEKNGLKTAQYLWARCDVPIGGITTHYCIPFEAIPGKDIFLENIMNALEKFDQGYDFVQVYTEHTDHSGHNFGPESPETQQAVRDLDDVLGILMEELEKRQLENNINIVIVSDHGMADTAPGTITRHEIDEYLDASLVENIADKGALMNIKVPQRNIQRVYDQLSAIKGVKVYKKNEIPEHLHYKNGKYVHDIVVMADEGNFVMASNSDKQLPLRDEFVYIGAHGYNPSLQTMKGIFFAKGPAFKKGKVIDPIHVVDVYQVLVKVLHLPFQPHNGTWNNVKDAFVEKYSMPLDTEESSSTHVVSSVLTLLLVVLDLFF